MRAKCRFHNYSLVTMYGLICMEENLVLYSYVSVVFCVQLSFTRNLCANFRSSREGPLLDGLLQIKCPDSNCAYCAKYPICDYLLSNVPSFTCINVDLCLKSEQDSGLTPHSERK